MALSTYTDLKQSILDILDEASLASQTDDFIDIAEARHRRELRIRAMLTRSTATPSNRFLALPVGYISMRRLQINTSPVSLLQQVTPDELVSTFLREGSGKPAFYTIHEELEFDRNPNANYEVEMVYWKQFTPLDDQNPTNFLLTNHPDIYLYASLLAAEMVLREDERITTWNSLYENALTNLTKQDVKGQFSGGALRSRVSGATP